MAEKITLVGSVDITALRGIERLVSPQTGKRLLCIPVDENPTINVYSDKQGKTHAVLNITARESPKNEYGHSHFITASIDKKTREAKQLTQEQVKALTPILGNFKTFISTPQGKSATAPDPLDDLANQDLPEELAGPAPAAPVQTW